MWMTLLHQLLRCRCLLSQRFHGPNERGQGMLEYAIIGGIVIVGAIATLAALSGALNQIFSRIASTLAQY